MALSVQVREWLADAGDGVGAVEGELAGVEVLAHDEGAVPVALVVP